MSLSWTGITKNKILTDSDINRAVEDGFLTSKITIPTTDKGVTKERALQYININPLHVSYTGKLFNQLITKEDIKKPCDQCTSYNIVINQSDLNNISGETDNKIYLYYYPCGTYSGDTPYLTFSYPGTFTNYICAQSCADTEPYLYSSFDGGSILTNSSYVELAGNCALSIYRSISCDTGFTYTISSPGITVIPNLVDIGQTYGNVPVTVSYTSLNLHNEVFIGNYEEKFGDIYNSSYGIQYVSDTIGFLSTKNKTTIDLIVYSSADSIFIPFDITINITCPVSGGTLDCGTNLLVKTYVSGTQIDVTHTGYIKYDTNTETVYKYISSTGMHGITDCYVYESLGVPDDKIYPTGLTYTVLYSGNTCDAGIDDCLEITFTSNSESDILIGWTSCVGAWRTRTLTIGETFTTCAIKNSGYGYGSSISQGILCSGTVTPADIYYNDVNAQYYLSAWFSNVKDNGNMCLGSPTSFYYVPGNGLFSTPTYIFQDAAGTIPFNFNYFIYSAISGLGSIGYEYNKTTGEVGLQTYICLG